MLRRALLVLALLVAAAVVAIPCWIALHARDLPAPEDADLCVTSAAVSPAENGYERFAEAAALLDWREDADERLRGMRNGEPLHSDWIRDTVARNQPAFEALEAGLAAPGFQLPPENERSDSGASETSCCDPLLDIQRLVRLSSAEARQRAADGDQEGAVERALLGLRTGRRLGSGQNVGLVGMMFAVACQGIALEGLEHVARSVSLPREASRRLVAELESQRLSTADWQRMWAVEYQHLKGIFQRALSGYPAAEIEEPLHWALRALPSSYLWQPNRFLSSLAEHHRDRQRRTALSCREAYAGRLENESDLEGRLRAARILVSPNSIGNLLLEISMPNSESFMLKRCHAETRISLVQALIGVKAYRDENGDLPAALDDLIPRHLGFALEDGFAGAPLRYSRERAVVYSLGEDFADEEGGAEPAQHAAAEPAVSLAF